MTVSVENEAYPIRKEPTVTPSFITTLNEDGENDVYDECDHSAVKSEQKSSAKLQSSEDLLVIPSSHGIPHIFGNSSLTRQKSVLLPSMKSNLEKIRFPSVDRIASTGTNNKRHSRSSTSTCSSYRSTVSSITRFDIDEIIFSLREKARHNFRELRHNFIINDPMGVGNIRREALSRVLTRLLYWPVKQKYVIQLLSQLGFPRSKEIISFTEFYAALNPRNADDCSPLLLTKENTIGGKEFSSNNNNKQLVPLSQVNTNQVNGHSNNSNNILALRTPSDELIPNSTKQESSQNWSFITELPPQYSTARPSLLAHQVMGILRQNLIKGSLQLDNLFNVNNYDGENQLIHRNEFFQKLSQLGLHMSNSEFIKFWKRFNPKNESSIPIEYFLQHMNLISNRNNELQSKNTLLAITNVDATPPNQSQLLSATDIISNLNRKFRKGYRKALKAIEICTKNYISNLERNSNSLQNNNNFKLPEGFTNADIFLEVLKYLKLPILEKIQLGKFFSRYGLTVTNNSLLPYAELFRRFQDRSEAGVVHQLLTDTLISKKVSSSERDENIIKLEREMTRKFHRDFLTLLNTLRNFDPNRSGIVSPSNFRIILFNHYGYEFSDEKFKEFLDHLPLDLDGNIKYAEFMRQFDSKIKTSEPSFEKQSIKNHEVKSPQISSNLKSDNKPTNDSSTDHIESESTSRSQTTSTDTKLHHRTMSELKQIIQEVLKSKPREIEKRFYELDEYNSGKLTQEQLYQLLKLSNIEPEITRGEIRQLWPEFFVDRKHCLSFHEFIRHFLYRKSDAAYPNAKLVPPRLGDADLMPCSNKLNGVTCLIKDSLRAKIDFMFDRLYKEFIEMDPKGTGFITHNQLIEVLTELCLQVSDRELDDLIEKFDIHKNGKISYLALLQPFVRNRLVKSNLDNKKSINSLTNQILRGNQLNQINSPLLPILNEVKPKVPLSRLNWSKMRRTMQQADKTGCGRLDAPVFRDIYQNATGVRLTDEQVYQLLTKLDPDVSGTLPYIRLLEDTQAICSCKEDEASQMKMSGVDNDDDGDDNDVDETTEENRRNNKIVNHS
ncbi:unnamed protein product [Trichobilharzia szidati]|nr:unnamed protein product [Trichobilharzia szidati]